MSDLPHGRLRMLANRSANQPFRHGCGERPELAPSGDSALPAASHGARRGHLTQHPRPCRSSPTLPARGCRRIRPRPSWRRSRRSRPSSPTRGRRSASPGHAWRSWSCSKTFQHLGRVARLIDVPAAVVDHVATAVGLRHHADGLAGYGDSTYRVRLASLVRGRLWRRCLRPRRAWDGRAGLHRGGAQARRPDRHRQCRHRGAAAPTPRAARLRHVAQAHPHRPRRGPPRLPSPNRGRAAGRGARVPGRPARSACGRDPVRMGPGQGRPAAPQPAAHARAPRPPRLAARAGRVGRRVRRRAGPQAPAVRRRGAFARCRRPWPHGGEQAPGADCCAARSRRH